MGEQEKELIKVICSVNIGDGTIIPNFYLDKKIAEKFAQALIQRYPQILAEKVWEGQSCLIESEQFTGTDGKNKLSLVWSNTNEKVNKTIEVFIREVPND